jgi:hypothetical protein
VTYEEALGIYRKGGGEEQGQVPWVLQCIATIFRAQDRLEPALAVFDETLRIYKKAYGENHPR